MESDGTVRTPRTKLGHALFQPIVASMPTISCSLVSRDTPSSDLGALRSNTWTVIAILTF
jgi:hypothetical protein